MKNKEKKLGSLNSVLILLQQLQVKYCRKCAFHLDVYLSGNTDVFVVKDDSDKGKMFSFCVGDDRDKWISTYEDLLSYLKYIENGE